AALKKKPEKDTTHEKIYGLLRKTSGIDFRLYKPGTVRRRTLRRMAVHKIDSVDDYLKHLHAHPEEVEQLYQDLLIPVTSCFGDPEAFEALKSTVFPSVLKDKSTRGSIRIWGPGCSTGRRLTLWQSHCWNSSEHERPASKSSSSGPMPTNVELKRRGVEF